MKEEGTYTLKGEIELEISNLSVEEKDLILDAIEEFFATKAKDCNSTVECELGDEGLIGLELEIKGLYQLESYEGSYYNEPTCEITYEPELEEFDIKNSLKSLIPNKVLEKIEEFYCRFDYDSVALECA